MSNAPNLAAPRDPEAPSQEPPRRRKPYKAPHIVRWGTLIEMTRALGPSGNPDGGRKPYQHTR
jgi:hypothetical protein